MPTYEYICENKKCQHEYEEYHSMNDPYPPCPKCKKKKVKRLISGGSGKGHVELSGKELKESLAKDVKDIKRKLRTDENYRANFEGPAWEKSVK